VPGLTETRPTPLAYERVRRAVGDLIRRGHFKPGDRLPSEHQLARRLRCSYHTVRRGMALLEDQRLIDRRVGSGTFVAQKGSPAPAGPSAVKTARTCLGVLCPSRLDSFAAEFLHHLHAQADHRNLSLVLRTVSGFGSAARPIVRELAGQGCPAVLVPWLPVPEPVLDLARLVEDSPIPVIFSKPLPGLEAHCREKPEDFGQHEAVTVETIGHYFMKLGFSRLAFFGPDTQTTKDLGHRLIAYSRFVSQHNLDNLTGLVPTGPEPVNRQVKKWASFAGNLAVICFDDDHAFRLMTALHKHNLRIPRDVAVFGFNNVGSCENSDPPLSTVQFNYDALADAILDHYDHLTKGMPLHKPKSAGPILVIRGSCGGVLRAGSKLDRIIQDARTAALTAAKSPTETH